MYKIYASGEYYDEQKKVYIPFDMLIYDDTSADPYVKVASPTLSLEESAAGSLKMTIPPGNAGYDYIVPMVTDIRVEKDGGIIWDGRVIQESKDFWNNRALTCEGALAFLNDTTQPQAEHSYTGGQAIRLYLEDLIAVHNAHAAANRRIEFDIRCAVDVAATDLTATTNYESTMECVNKLVEEHGGFLRIRYVNGSRLLDYLTDNSSARNINKQTIEFGKNLMDFTSSLDSTEYATVIVPLGAKLEDKKVEGLENYLTVEGSSLGDGTRYVKAAQDVIDQRGWIEKVVHFDDETDEDNLYKLGEKYLNELQYNTLTIELSAFDLHYLNSEIETVHLGDIIRVISEPHGIDRDFKVRKLEIPMDRPQDTTFQLGDNVQTSLTSTNNKINSEILAKLNEAPDINADAILQAAQDNASALMNMTLNGFVTLLTETDPTTGIYSEGLYISASRPLKDDNGNFVAQRFWKWTSSGLGYTDNYGQPGSWKVAMTMDGSIVGERIAAGSIHGSKITAGTLDIVTSSGQSGLSIGLSSRGMTPGNFEIGNIDQNGKNTGATDRARSIVKIYLAATATVTLNSTSYWFEPMEYSDSDDSESGFVRGWGEPTDRVFTVSSANYYRFVVRKVTSGTISDDELNTIAAAFNLGGKTAVFTAQDFQFLGAVTFTDLENPASSTFINGANITTGTVTANKINLKGIEIRSTKMDRKDVPEYTSFSVDENGEVTVNGKITLGEGSSISWGSVTEKPTYLEKNRIYSPNIEGGTITGGTITGETIEGGTISGTNISGSTFEVRSDTGNIMFYKDSQAARAAGVITYYTQTSQSDNSPEGLAITAYVGHALKLTGGAAGGGLSLDGSGEGIFADDLMLLDHGFATKRGVGFGTSAQRNALGTVREGYLFFQID